MNVSRKILVIIYIIFALLISVVIFAPQSILYSSFSDLQEEEATDNVEKVENRINFQILDLVETNAVLSSREDIRDLMLGQGPHNLSEIAFTEIFSISDCDFIFLVNNSGYIVYSEVSSFNSFINASNFPEIRQRINDGSFLCKEAESPLKGLLLLENGPAVISSQPVLAIPENSEISGTIILGKSLDEGFEVIKAYSGREGLQKIFSEQQPDILILDLIMPEISGFDIYIQLEGKCTHKRHSSYRVHLWRTH